MPDLRRQEGLVVTQRAVCRRGLVGLSCEILSQFQLLDPFSGPCRFGAVVFGAVTTRFAFSCRSVRVTCCCTSVKSKLNCQLSLLGSYGRRF